MPMRRHSSPAFAAGLLAAGSVLLLAGCAAPAASGAPPVAASNPVAAAAGAPAPTKAPGAPAPTPAPASAAPGAESAAGDEPTVVYSDAAQHFRFAHPQSWGKTTQPGEAIRLTGRDEFISVSIITTSQPPLDYARADTAALTAASPGYASAGPKSYSVAKTTGAMVAYTWQAGPSPVTGKTVPSSANRYYIPGPGGKLAVLTYSAPKGNYDPAGADDFANAFQWLP